MTVRCLKKGLPNGFMKGVPGLILAHDLSITRSRLKAKLLVFKTTKDVRNFWKKFMGDDLGKDCLGFVNRLSMTYSEKGKELDPSHMEVDPRFFCVIGLCQPYLNMETITHESVHAGFAFSGRKMRAPWWKHINGMPEEAVCYPAGRIAAAINRVLHKEGLYEQ